MTSPVFVRVRLLSCQLADRGADVIMVEPPVGEDEDTYEGRRHGPDFQNLHRNKRSITLTLKIRAGVAVLKRLTAKADVLVENFTPGRKDPLWESITKLLRAINERLIYASISGRMMGLTASGRVSTRLRREWVA